MFEPRYSVVCYCAAGTRREILVRAASESRAIRAAIRELTASTGDASWLPSTVLPA